MTEQTREYIGQLLEEEEEKSRQAHDYIVSLITNEAKFCNDTPDYDPAMKAYCAGRSSAAMQILKKLFDCVGWFDMKGIIGESELHFESICIDGEEIFHD